MGGRAGGALAEREEEVTALRAAAGRAASGHGCLVVVDGAPGVGKSTLVGVAMDIARDQGLVPHLARAGQLETAVPYAAARALLRDVAATGGGVGIEALVRTLLSGSSPTAETAATLHVPDLGLLVEAAAREHGLCLLLDDAHWADAASLALVAHLVLRLPALPLLLVVAARDREPGEGEVLEALRADPETVLLRPAPLSAAGTGNLVRARLGEDAAPPFCDACAEVTGGNPFLLHQLLADLVTAEIPATAANTAAVRGIVPARVRASVAARLAGLPPAAAPLARALHVLGDGTMLRCAAALAGLEHDAAAVAADALAVAGICRAGDPLSFAHPLLAAAAGEELQGFERSRLHRAAADLLAAEGESPLRVAAHLLAVAPAGDPVVAAVLRAAAADAATLEDHQTAARMLRRAVAEPVPAAERGAVLVDLALAEARGGAPGAIDTVRTALTLAGTGSARVSLLRALARLQWLGGRIPDAAATSAEALAAVPADDERHEELLAELLAALSMDRMNVLLADTRLQRLVERATGGWVPRSPALAAALAAVLPMAGHDVRLVGPLAERALAGDVFRPDAVPYGLALDFVVGGLILADELDRARQLVERSLVAARRDHDVARLGQWSYWQAVINRAAGRLDDAVDDAVVAIDASRGAPAAWLGFTIAVLAETHLDRGDLEAAAAALAGADGLVALDQLAGAGVLTARARLQALVGEPAGSLATYRTAESLLDVLGQREAPMLPWRPRAARTAAAAGDAELAQRLVAAELQTARATGAPGRLSDALRAAAAVGPADAALPFLREAVALIGHSERRLDRAAALADLGAALRRSGAAAEAREPLAEALQAADACGAVPLAEHALAELRATGARPRRRARSGPEALTAAERRVVELARRGLSNRAIAAELVVSTKTVEWHLRQTYTKLGIASRGALEGALAAPDAVAAPR